MQAWARVAVAVGLAWVSACAHGGRSAAHGGGAVIYLAKKVRTLDPERPAAQALGVEGGKVVAVGSPDEVRRAVGSGAREVGLGEAVLVPGLADAHGHLLGLGRALSIAALGAARSAQEAADLARRAGPESRQGDWVVGRGWDQNDWTLGEQAFPHRRVLDELFGAKAVFLTRVDGHAAWVSSEALRRANLTAKTLDPPGGRIVRDEHGEPTGVLVDNAMDLVSAAMPQVTQEQRRAWLVAALKRCAQAGLTSIHDAGMDLQSFRQLQEWDAVGLLPLRVYAVAAGQGPDAQAFEDQGPFSGRMLQLRAVKFLLDGALGSRGAALFEPYTDEPEHRGLLLMEPEELQERARRFMARGFQVAVHAIGDRANALAVEALGGAAAQVEEDPGRHRVEHLQVVRREDLERMKALGLVASMQPTHATSDMPWAKDRVGARRLEGGYAWRSVLEQGIPLALGSDFPVESPEPLKGLYAARFRQDASGSPQGGWTPGERLSGQQALEGFTVGPAFASFAEERRGRLREGMDADFVALSADPAEAGPRELLEARVLLTVVAGEVVYDGR
jgi:predicted amidohydrolase YtcJ